MAIVYHIRTIKSIDCVKISFEIPQKKESRVYRQAADTRDFLWETLSAVGNADFRLFCAKEP